jgi:tetratricopeptide (TPR) repeat protein
MTTYQVAAIGLAVVLARPQDDHSSHRIPTIPAELLERPVMIRTGIGTAHDAVTTSSPDAQKFYDQGLAYLHHYNWIEASRSFNQTLRLDAKLALAYIGLSYAYAGVNQPGAARHALEQARAMGPAVSEHERRHITVRDRQIAAEDAPRDASKVAAYRRALDEALAEFPDDAELWLRRGVAESSDPADDGQGSTASAVRFYSKALEVVPDHFAAHHYLIHAYENTGRIQEALAHAVAYARLAPDIPHARHMHGHELRRAGRIQQAIAEFEAADRLEKTYFMVEGVAPEYDWHYEHNLDLLATSYQYSGQMGKSEQLLKAAFALPTWNLVQAVSKRQWPLFLRARGRVDEALAAAGILTTHPNPVVQAVGHIEEGYARLVKGQFAEAAAAANAALAVMKSAPPGAALAALPFEGLQGEFYLRTGQRDKGRAMLEQMVKKARAAPGPDEWSQALFSLELIARAARDVGDWELAGRMARQMLDHDPSYAGTQYALALVADHDGNRRAATAAMALAEKDWREADPGLTELRDVRDWLRRHP